MDVVNNMILNHDVKLDEADYKVSVGNYTYYFKNLDFFQGLLTGAAWDNINPHPFITNLQQIANKPEGMPTGPRWNLRNIQDYDLQWVNLQY